MTELRTDTTVPLFGLLACAVMLAGLWWIARECIRSWQNRHSQTSSTVLIALRRMQEEGRLPESDWLK